MSALADRLPVTLILLLHAVSSTAAGSGSELRKAIPWDTIREDIKQSICIQVSRDEGEEHRLPYIGPRDGCGHARATAPVSLAVDKAVLDAGLPLLLAEPEELGFERDAKSSLREMNRRWRDACLASGLVLRPILAFLPAALAEQGLSCHGCPGLATGPPRHVSWEELAPYVGAYFWPNPVTTPVGADGRPSGKPRYGYHICIGINGLEGIDHLDPVLARAGLVVAKGSNKVKQVAQALFFESILESAEFRVVDNDEARTSYLRVHLPAAVASDPATRIAACEVLARYSAAVGVALDGCGTTELSR